MESIKLQQLLKKHHTKKKYPNQKTLNPDLFLIYLWFLAQPIAGKVPLKAGQSEYMKRQQKRDSSPIRKNIIRNIYCMQSLLKASSLELFCSLLLDSFVSMCRNKVWQYSPLFLSKRVNIFRVQAIHGTLKMGWFGLLCIFFDMRNHSYQNNSCYFQLNQPETKILPMYLFHPTFLVKRTRDSSDRETSVLVNSDG